MVRPDRRIAALWLTGLALALVAWGFAGASQSVPVIAGTLGGVAGLLYLRGSAEPTIYLASGLMLIGGVWQLPWFFVFYAGPHPIAAVGAASSAALLAAGVLALGAPMRSC